ncbi:MAG: mannonate dehydratase [Mucilaginibacter sp.]|nr:mannonate dehydratase [Mucilaginibacter sp.]
MKNTFSLLFLLALYTTGASAQKVTDNTMPRIVKSGNNFQFIVDGRPFLILGGELGNSSASSSEYMKPVWPKLKAMQLNTVLAPVYWELLEPAEGKFNFSLVDDLLRNARLNNMKLVLLWFGTWKNSMSCYVPAWVKTDPARFPRIVDRSGNQQEILNPINKNNLEADKHAYVRLLQHLKEVDSKDHTVIMIQVENEIGMLPDARNFDNDANKAFESAVPDKLLSYLKNNQATLLPELKAIWQANGSQTSGNWTKVFGNSLVADEIFMAWQFADFVNEIAIAGKKVYDLPLYLNAALNRPGVKPGDYPSAGPLPHVMDIWKARAPEIDILAPDFYNPDFKHWCDLYTRIPNPLFIPEIKFEPGVDAKAFFAFGNYNCLSFSPFSIESTESPEKEPITKAYWILKQITPLITKYQPSAAVKGCLFDKNNSAQAQQFTLGNYLLKVTHEYKLGWSAGSKDSTWPETGVIIIAVAPDEYYVAGTGVVITFEAIEERKKAGLLSVDEGSFQNGKWIEQRRMNGDQDHQGRHIRIPVNEYSIQHVKLYSY